GVGGGVGEDVSVGLVEGVGEGPNSGDCPTIEQARTAAASSRAASPIVMRTGFMQATITEA
ncbi:MAG: hypothetical protein GX495_00305, partial [Chloroflexi bacterium]|nr:hypothetical protein [Chloroflexota bacterium]